MVIIRFVIYLFYIIFIFFNVLHRTRNPFALATFIFIPIIISEILILIYNEVINKYREIKVYEIIKLVSNELSQALFNQFILDYRDYRKKGYKEFINYTFFWFNKNIPEYDINNLINEDDLKKKALDIFLNLKDDEDEKYFKVEYLYPLYVIFILLAFFFHFFQNYTILYMIIDMIFLTICFIYYSKYKEKKISININCISICLVSMITTNMIIIFNHDYTFYMIIYIFIKIIYSLIFILSPFSMIYNNDSFDETNYQFEKNIYEFVKKNKNVILWCCIFIIIGYNIACFSFFYF